MLATLITSGSAAASTQTACGRRVRTIRSETIRCSRRFLSLCRSCSPRWSSTAGSELRRVEPARATVETLAPERRTSSSGLAPTKAASGVPQQKQKQAENCSRIAPKSAAGSWAEGEVTSTSRARTTLRISPASIRRVASPTIASKSPGGRALRISGWALGWGSSIGSASPRSPARRTLSSPSRRSGSSPGETMALTVREARPSLRQIESCGRVSEAGGSEDHGAVEAPCGSKAKPPAQTGPAPAGRPGGPSTSALRPVAKALGGDVREALQAARGGLVGAAECRQRKAAVRLLPAEPPIGGKAGGEGDRAGIDVFDRDRDADQGAATALGRPPDQLAETGEEALSRYREQSRSRRCGPSRPGRGGGPSSRRPRSCRPSPSPRSSSSAARRRRSSPGRSRRTG